MIQRIWDITLSVADLSRAVEFYGEVLGLQMKYRFGDYAGFDCGGVEIGLKTWGERDAPRKGEPCVNFLVDDVEEAFRTLTEKGVRFTREPGEAQWGARYALFADPDGHELQVSEVNWAEYFAACAPK